jgi:hypothetical protein
MSSGNYKRLWVWLTPLFLLYLFIEAQGEGDLYIYLSAAGALKHGGDIYVMDYIQGQYHYYYSVLFALLLQPFYSLPFYGVKFCWLLLNAVLFIHLLKLLIESDFVKILSEKQTRIFVLLLLIFSARFLHENIHASQITIVIFWCSVYGVFLVQKGKALSGGLLLAVGINIKLLPVLLLPYLLYRGYFAALACCGAALLVFYFLPSLLIGHQYNLLLLQSWFNLVNPTQARHVLDVDERSFHGLSTLLSTLLVKEAPDLYALPLKRNIADISLEALAHVLLAVRLCLLAFTLYFLRSLPFRKADNPWKQCMEVAYLLLLIPLLFPHQQHYAFLFAVPAFAMLLYYLVCKYKSLSRGERRSLTVLLSLIYLCANLKILLGEFNQYFEHYKILSYGALLLIPLLAWLRARPDPVPVHPASL